MSILNRKHKLKTLAAAVAACLIVTVGTGTAYASDLGGIQRKVQLWIHGDQTTATLTINSDGSYTGTYADKDGKNKEFGGGGIAQRPKLLNYIPTMKENISKTLKVDPDQVNVKATTEEHLGFTGEGLGISAQAVCLLNETK